MPTKEQTLVKKFRIEALRRPVPTETRGHEEFARLEIKGVPIEREGDCINAVQITFDGVHVTIRQSDLNNAIYGARGVHGVRFIAEPASGRSTRERYYAYLISSDAPTTKLGCERRARAFLDSLLEFKGLMAKATLQTAESVGAG